jgi:DNA-binding NtrC family response regulator
MVCNLSEKALTAMAACPLAPSAPERETESNNACRSKPSMAADILCIGADPTLAVYLSGLFQPFGWTISHSVSPEEVGAFLESNRVAVAVCEEAWPGAAWQDVLSIVNSVPSAPMFVVVGSDRALLEGVLVLGGFDVLTRPLREAEVIWTVASAWHQWMTRFEGQHTGDPRCSDA